MRFAALALTALLLAVAPASRAADPAAPLSFAEARHLLTRTGFAARPAEIAALQGLSRRVAVERLLAGARAEAVTPLPEWTKEAVAIRPPVPPRLMSEDERRAYQRKRRDEAIALVNWWYAEMVATPSPLTERMTLFWHNHFTSEFRKVRAPILMQRQNALLRREALGNFGRLLQAVARDPAMTIYLDSRANRKDRPNENFARELLELFTLGEGRGYTERDIKEAARAFTGWSLDPDSGEFRFRPGQHDGGGKTFMGRTGNFGGEDIIRMLLENPRTAEHIAEKAWREFVGDKPDAAEIKRIAAKFRAAGYDTRTLLRELFLAPAFWDPSHRGTLVRSPVELLVGTMRLFGIAAPADSPVLAQLGRQLGQEIFNPPNVKGWPGGTAWINANTLLVRRQVLTRLAAAPAANDAAGERGRRAMAMSGVDLDAWYAALPEPMRQPATLTALLLPIAPVDAPAEADDPARFIRGLLLDPTYQLK
jgi:uncharacterized protein (DUF1800 family)